MVRERKTRVKDIEKLHELIDSASLPKHKMTSPNEAEKLELMRKRLSDDSFSTPRHLPSSNMVSSQSARLQPVVVVHKQEEIQKKDDKVIQIDLRPRPIKQAPERPMVEFLPVQEDQFAKESLFEIEKIAQSKKSTQRSSSKTAGKQSAVPEEFIPVSAPQRDDENLPEFLPVQNEPSPKKSVSKIKAVRRTEAGGKAEPPKPEKRGFFLVTQGKQNDMPSFEPMEFAAVVRENKEPMRFELDQKPREDLKQKRITEKKVIQDGKEKEKEAKHDLEAKEQHLKIETAQSLEIQQQEQPQKGVQTTHVLLKDDEKELEERYLKKEQEKEAKLELVENKKREKAERKQKKIDERKARIELRERKQETKRLAKEHDRKLKLEWIEFQHQQRQIQKRKDFEQKKAAVETKGKEKEQQHLFREQKVKLQVEQIGMIKKEKEVRRLQRIETKKAKRNARIQERKARRLAKQKEIIQKIEAMQTLQKELMSEKQKEFEQKQSAEQAEEKQREEQRLLTEMEEKSRLELLEMQKEETEHQKIMKVNQEKRTVFAPSPETKKQEISQGQTAPVSEEKPEKVRKKLFGTKKEEQKSRTTWKSSVVVTQKELKDHQPDVTIPKQETDTQRQIEKEKKREQKRLEKEQKEKAREERLELLKKEKEQRIQKKLEEKERERFFTPHKVDAELWKSKEPDKRLLKKQEKENEHIAQAIRKEEQRKKEQEIAVKEKSVLQQEKNELRQKQREAKKDREHLSSLSFGKAKETGLIDERKQAEQQKQTMDLVRIAAEEKELRKTKAFERKMQKEQRKKEKEERKYKMKEEEKAKKNMDLHMKEEILKEKSLNQQSERNDPFIAFDSIDQKAANILGNAGYTTIEKLGEATVKDLVKIGLKKKVAQKIIAECGEFVEWQVFDSIERF